MRFAGGTSDLGIAACTKPTCEFAADVEFHIGVTHQQRLGVGVHCDEFDAFQPGVDHAVDRIHATATDTDDFDHCEIILRRACHQGTSDICSNTWHNSKALLCNSTSTILPRLRWKNGEGRRGEVSTLLADLSGGDIDQGALIGAALLQERLESGELVEQVGGTTENHRRAKLAGSRAMKM